MEATGAASKRGTGARLVRSLAQQLGGELTLENDPGLTVTLVFRLGTRLQESADASRPGVAPSNAGAAEQVGRSFPAA